MIPWLADPAPVFPSLDSALEEPNGLLAAGGALDPHWLITAYSQGIFPWFSEDQPILWWSPDPRMVVFPRELRISRSLRKTLLSRRFELRCDTAFAQVIASCAAPRSYAQGTWILPEMQSAYCRLHELAWAHSVEAWRDGRLVGGLYGIAIGRAFFGESMFHLETDASKVAFAHLARALERENFSVIDCQMSTPHLASLGGREIPRCEFAEGLKRWAVPPLKAAPWPAEFIHHDWNA